MPARCETRTEGQEPTQSRNLIPEAQEFVRQTLKEMPPKDRTGRFASGGFGHADAVLASMMKFAAESGMPHSEQRKFWEEAAPRKK